MKQDMLGKGGLVELDKIMGDLSKEIEKTLKAMAKAKDINEREIHSRIIKNLCKSQGVFLELASEMMSLNIDDDFDEEDIPF